MKHKIASLSLLFALLFTNIFSSDHSQQKRKGWAKQTINRIIKPKINIIDFPNLGVARTNKSSSSNTTPSRLINLPLEKIDHALIAKKIGEGIVKAKEIEENIEKAKKSKELIEFDFTNYNYTVFNGDTSEEEEILEEINSPIKQHPQGLYNSTQDHIEQNNKINVQRLAAITAKVHRPKNKKYTPSKTVPIFDKYGLLVEIQLPNKLTEFKQESSQPQNKNDIEGTLTPEFLEAVNQVKPIIVKLRTELNPNKYAKFDTRSTRTIEVKKESGKQPSINIKAPLYLTLANKMTNCSIKYQTLAQSLSIIFNKKIDESEAEQTFEKYHNAILNPQINIPATPSDFSEEGLNDYYQALIKEREWTRTIKDGLYKKTSLLAGTTAEKIQKIQADTFNQEREKLIKTIISYEANHDLPSTQSWGRRITNLFSW